LPQQQQQQRQQQREQAFYNLSKKQGRWSRISQLMQEEGTREVGAGTGALVHFLLNVNTFRGARQVGSGFQ
jgi:hypothetical protein